MTRKAPAMASQPPASARTGKMHAGRQADSARRRQRVIAAIDQASASGSEISVSGIARTAGVDRTFFYRHRDLLAAHERAARLNARIRQLEKRLSQALGEQAWQQSGLGTPADTDALNNKITQLEQQAAGLRLQLSERDDELAAARAANRELITRINHNPRTR